MSKLLIKQTAQPEQLGDFACINLGHDKIALVDHTDYEHIKSFRWYAKQSAACFYAVRKIHQDGHTQIVRMHRQLTNCPDNLEVHHKNLNPLDNRKSNLQVVTHDYHLFLHYWDYVDNVQQG